MRLPFLAALLACDPEPLPRPEGTEPPGATSEATDEAPFASVTVAVRPGVRDLVATAQVTDPQGDPVTVTWSWTVDGSATSWATERVPATAIRPGQVWVARALPSDGVHTGAPGEAAAEIPQPLGGNVIVVMLDDVGVDKIGLYGLNDQAPPTPTLDALAADGIRFTNAYAAPSCSPTRALALTGRFGRRTGNGVLIDMNGDPFELPLEAWTLPEALREARGAAPWSSWAVGKWHAASYDAPSGLDHPVLTGFDAWSGSFGYLIDGAATPPLDGYFTWRKVVDGVEDITSVYNTTDTIDDAIVHATTSPEPFFLWVGLNAAHTPLHAPPADLITQAVDDDSPDPDLHRAMVESADTELGRLLAAMDPDVLARTTVIVTSDNGTADFAMDPAFDPARGKGTVYEGGVRVPLVIAGPHVRFPGSVTDRLVHLGDLYPTVADLAGVPLVDVGDGVAVVLGDGTARALDGISLLPWLDSPAAAGRQWLYAETFSPNGPGPYTKDLRTVRDLRWKLVRDAGGDELYELLPGAVDEGPDLLPTATPEQLAAYEALVAELDRLSAELVYEGW